MDLKRKIKQVWLEKIEQNYEKQLSRKKISYDTWVKEQESNGICQEPDVVSGEIGGDEEQDYVLLRQRRGCLSSHALSQIRRYLAAHPQVQILYGDEDVMTEEGIRENPWYKPCWSPDTYLSRFYVGSVIAVRRTLLEAVRADLSGETREIVFDDPGQVRPFLGECIRLAGGFARDCKGIARCPHILFHVTGEQVWEDYLRSGESGEPDEKPEEDGSNVAVIIPSKDHPEILSQCLKSLQGLPGLEIIIVDNGSSEENQGKLDAITKGMKYLYHPMHFNFSRMCNLGAEMTRSDFLLFLNDDIEVCGREWLAAMKKKAGLPYVGAVGLKLYYPDGDRIQHAGITNLPVGPVHKMQFAEDRKGIYFETNRGEVNCLAVTGACLMIEKKKYVEMGGFQESLPVAYNDVELGFALYEAGYQNVVLNTHFAYHHESLSRGSDAGGEKLARLQRERTWLYEMHPKLRDRDPYYPTGLSRDGLDSRIVPEYFSARNSVQKASPEILSVNRDRIREDNCLFLGVEQSSNGAIRGYGVVLGDNNACYDRYLALRADTGQVYVMKTKVQYRQDLEENMPDQENVALCGFHVQIPEQAWSKLSGSKSYQIGVMAVHKMNRGRLINWSEKYLQI